MRIAHVIRRLSFDDWGGTEQVVWNIAKAQKAAGHEVRLFATTALWRSLAEKGAKAACPYAETVDGIEIVRFKPIYPWWPMPKKLVDELDRKGGNPFVPGLGKALREWKPDVIHCHAMARIAELCLRTARSLKHCKTAISLHGGGANVPGEEAKSLKAPTRGRLPWGKMIDVLMGWTRRVPEDFGGIVCVGEDEYGKYRAKHAHAMYLPNGVDCSLFEGHGTRDAGRGGTEYDAQDTGRGEKPDAECAETAGAGHVSCLTSNVSRPLRILCVARIDRQKNQMALVEWLARNPDAALRLVGPVTQQDYREELESRAVALGVSDRVTFTGALKPGSKELLAEYANADVFVLPSRHEPFGIVVLEAWAAGLPVVASGVGGLGKLCAAHPDAALVYDGENACGLEKALGEFVSRLHSGAASEMKKAGLAAAKEYDWRTLSSRLVDFYAEI